ncbi:MAG: hypothetical protein DRJ38_09975 [Thermoprotei archaeon]|nr:MAG: hypothetical protein DRJ38_09975 [Thermoprotei archaeon]
MLKLLLDENIGLKVYYELEKLGFDVKSVYVAARSASDEEVIRLAKDENRIIVTMTKILVTLHYPIARQALYFYG